MDYQKATYTIGFTAVVLAFAVATVYASGGETEESAHIVDYESDIEDTEDWYDVHDDGTVTGNIVSSNPSKVPYVSDVTTDNGVTHVTISLEETEQFSAQVISGINYELEINDPEDDIVVTHNNWNSTDTEL